MDNITINTNNTKDKISEAALSLFQEKGYGNVSVSDICRACNITRGTFYYHFKSKDDTLYDIYEPSHEIVLHDLKKILNKDSYIEQFYNLHSIYLQRNLDIGPQITKLIIKRYIDKSAEVTSSQFDVTYDLYVSLINKAQDAGEILSKVPAEILGETAVHITYSLVLKWCSMDGDFDIKTEFRNLMNQIFELS